MLFVLGILRLELFPDQQRQPLSRTCAALDEAVGTALEKSGAPVRKARPSAAIPVSGSNDDIKEQLGELSKKEREIIAYLLRHNQRMFTAEMDGGHAATLIARGIVRNALRPGQAFDVTDVPMEIAPSDLE